MDIDFLAGLPTGRGGTEVFQEVDVEVKRFHLCGKHQQQPEASHPQLHRTCTEKKPFGIKDIFPALYKTSHSLSHNLIDY